MWHSPVDKADLGIGKAIGRVAEISDMADLAVQPVDQHETAHGIVAKARREAQAKVVP